MSKCSAASPARASCGYAKCGQMSENVLNANHVSLRAGNRDCSNGQGPGHVSIHSQEPRERPFSVVSFSNGTPRSHQRRWSADFSRCATSPVIIVRKNKKEPQPPQRSVSLLRPNSASHPSFKRYSCPPIGVSPRYRSSSSSSSSTCSCSSPPPVQTSVITGPDPLGWKLRPKSSSTSPRARANRLSLQIPLPVIFPDPNASPGLYPQSDNAPNPDPSPKTKPPLRPKPSRRRHSDSSTFLRSFLPSVPAVTLEELCAVHLRTVSLSDDDVFSGGSEKEAKATTRPRKIPPPVAEKTAMARQIAQLIAHSRQRCNPKENIYATVTRPNPKHTLQTEHHSRLHGRKTEGLRVDTSCDRERSTPRFPG
ncbi:uncharacterized protein LOC118330551 [Morone saxatilis]|uniref:uncharacterized protein LOC118330551 n=1 Tax=Morone saxatilis TaxID=34816 RepID=UPI0015E1D009|nr:uncharacterized protein LOC118330551 [Morone saxatilis]